MKISVYFFLNKVGRKPSEVGALFLTGVFLTINMFVPKGLVSVNSIPYFKDAFNAFQAVYKKKKKISFL